MKTKSLEMKWFSFFSNSFRQIRNFRIRFAKKQKIAPRAQCHNKWDEKLKMFSDERNNKH